MNLNFSFFLYALIFLAALLLVEGLYYLYLDTRGGTEAVNRRLRMLASGAKPREVYAQLRRMRYDRGRQGSPFGWAQWKLNQLITFAGLTIAPQRIVIIMLALAVIAFAMLAGIAPTLPIDSVLLRALVPLLLSIVIGCGLPVLFLQQKAKQRMKKFGEQLPDALDVMVRSLHAGHPISAALTLVSKEMSDPLGSEFGLAVDEMTYGLDLHDAINNLGRRVPLDDFQYVVIAVNTQHDTGGNLAEVLEGLSRVIRARFQMFRKIHALSGEGRVSARLLLALPFVTVGIINFIAPNYYVEAAKDPVFWPVVLGTLCFMGLGAYVMWRMVNFRV